MDFNRYFTNEQLYEQLLQWKQGYSSLLRLDQLGTSYEGNPIWMAVVTNHALGNDREKPAVWIDANIHATEIAGTTTALRIIYELLQKYGQEEQVTRLLDTSVYYIVPRVNPDGAALAMASIPRYIRSGTRPYPYEDAAEGIHAQDIDQDGRILQMRVLDPSGDWKISTINPRLLEKRKPDEHGGTYYRLFPEGLIQDYDGYLVKLARPVQGLDFNRNFPAEWRPEGDQSGAGPYPASEPEVRAIVDFFSTHQNINLGITYHTFSGVILRPFSDKPDSDMDTSDLWTYQAIGERGSEITGYKCISVYHDFKYHPREVTSGAFDDWAYKLLGVFAFTIELWDIVGRAGIEERKFIEWFRKHPHADDAKILEWAEQNGLGQEYVDWYPYHHPQLGDIEIGGWNSMYTWRNPPLQFMGEEAERNVGFPIALGEMLPHLSIHTLDVHPLGNDQYHVNLVIDNTGYLPTCTSNQGKSQKAVRPVRVKLDLPESVTLVQGKRLVELGHLEGRSNKMSTFGMGTAPTDHRARTEWVLKAPASVTIPLEILSDRAGIIHETIKLG